MSRWIARALFALIVLPLSVVVRPMALLDDGGTDPVPNLLAGVAAVAAALALERLMLAAPAARIAGVALGLLGGGLIALLAALAHGGLPAGLRVLGLAVGFFVGGAVGVRLCEAFADRAPAARGGGAGALPGSTCCKIVDTSVVIDGRIADVCETGLLEGVLLVPGFVLRELQYIADSADPLRRARGRKGLEVLERLKKSADVKLLFPEDEIPEIREVDEKLVELARRTGGKLLTQDLNLNKVAGLRGVPVLNLNDLANALKPVVLPGESLRVSIVKEGKEPEQGVAYLDDGTMVVVDRAKRLIGRTVDVEITSVLQTTAGKLFFARIPGADNGAGRPAFPDPPAEAG